MKRLSLFVALIALVSTVSPSVAQSATPLRVWVSPATFSPDGDGYRDRTTIVYNVPRNARVYIYVYKGATYVRRLVWGRYATAGNYYRTSWNGGTGSGLRVPNGTYGLRVVARFGPGLRYTLKYQGTIGVAAKNVASTGRWVGFYVPGAPFSTAPLTSLESKVSSQARVVHYFHSSQDNFDSAAASNAIQEGAIPMATMEFWRPGSGVGQPAYRLSRIAAGDFDSYLRRYADDAKAFGKTIWLRPLHEMNGNWYPWAGTVNGNSPSHFISAWRHIKQVFASRGATNVKFVWCPNAESVPNTYANGIARYWPGEAYVDYVALDGYNFGTSASWSRWRSFAQIFGPAYSTITKLTPKSIIIAETGCSPRGGDKAAWIDGMFGSIHFKYRRIRGVVWFNENKETDWRVDSSSATAGMFRLVSAVY
ncbi:MAG: hypothetical protein C4521_09120 [Actinobacteria bacterium]|nr:MAG: hypothetical protein C4521_09120 [Actinomycetota bacterium]